MFYGLFSRKPKSRSYKPTTQRSSVEQLESRQLLSASPLHMPVPGPDPTGRSHRSLVVRISTVSRPIATAASLAIKTPASAIVGVPVWVRVTALDASGNPVWNYSNANLVLSSVDLAASVPIPAST